MAKVGTYSPTTQYERMATVSFSMGGKTTLNAHLPTDDAWAVDGEPGKIVYIAADLTSPSLDSIATTDRDRLIIVTPDGEPSRSDDEEGEEVVRLNWIQEANRMAITDWKAHHPQAVALVWDSFTTTAKNFLLEIAKLDFYDTRHTSETVELAAQRMERGVYNIQQLAVEQTLGYLIARNPNLHIYVTFQPAQTKSDPRSGMPMCYGPEIGGQKGPVIASPKFSTQLHVTNNEGRLTIETQKQGMYMAGIKVPAGSGNPIPVRCHIGVDEIDHIREFHKMVRRLKLGQPVGDVPFEVEF